MQLRNKSLWLFSLFFLLGLCIFPLQAQKKEGSTNVQGIRYKSAVRDPFLPLPIINRFKEKKEINPAQELGELKIVGIIKKDGERFVLIEDKEGKGMILKRGCPISENLWIKEVKEKEVVFAYKLKEEIRQIVMELPKKWRGEK